MGSALDLTYGAMLIGVLFATFFQGVLSVQAYIYYESFPDDQRRTKLLVAAVWLLDVTHLVLICNTLYHYLITSWGDAAALLVPTPELELHVIFVGLPSLLCQAFFVHRIWLFTRGNWVLASALGAACLATCTITVLISARLVGAQTVAAFSHQTSEVIAMFGLGAAVDVAIALVLVFYLQQGTTHFDRTSFVVARVVNYTVATGVATSILAIACLIAYLLSSHTFVFIAMHFSLGRLYTNALLATLNSRRALRQRLQNQPSFAVVTTRIINSVADGEYPLSTVTVHHSIKDTC
ncbi:hypothetical protein B0H15DRAFT_870625 [Mycena belliarum]|uniref:DUF6534 domain-containing protein n=1 Tax=Mycena belliarum TaxID=1033014 RepID=A0AAD6TPJ8_9AGAR|nr:hypothetical protein B0H15DRAFT_870625 [Mycena belliae]